MKGSEVTQRLATQEATATPGAGGTWGGDKSRMQPPLEGSHSRHTANARSSPAHRDDEKCPASHFLPWQELDLHLAGACTVWLGGQLLRIKEQSSKRPANGSENRRWPAHVLKAANISGK